MTIVRQLALNALHEVLGKGFKPREVLDHLSGSISAKDRAFLMETVYGVLRHRDRLDWTIDRFLKKPSGVKGFTRDNLRLGAYQISDMRVPEWAAVDEAVSLEQRHAPLVNAVLRNIIRNKDVISGELKDMRLRAMDAETSTSQSTKDISVLTSHPTWLIRRWINRFGAKESLALAEADNRIPPLTLRVNVLKAGRDEVLAELKESGIDARPTKKSSQGIRLKGTRPISEIAEYLGKVYVQDEAAQLVSEMLGPEPGERVLDACAAPGGKTTHMAEMMKNKGEVVAVEVDERRIAILRENIEVMGASCVKVINGDITALEGLGTFDRVLIDAPCSSLGVIRRNPDVKYRHKASDLSRLAERQGRILEAASKLLKPGGTLLYCTCSTEPEEGEQVVQKFLKTSGDFININIGMSGEDFMRTFPHRDDMDGFFAARLK